MATGKKKSYNFREAEISTNLYSASLNCNDMNTNIDSRDEIVADRDVSVLSGNQLLVCAVLEIKLTNAKVVRSNDDEQNKTNDNQDLAPEVEKKKKKSKVKHINK